MLDSKGEKIQLSEICFALQSITSAVSTADFPLVVFNYLHGNEW